MKRGAGDLYPALKAAVKEATVDVRVSKTSCMGVCATGSTVVIMPDNIWLGEVSVDDIPEILAMLSVE